MANVLDNNPAYDAVCAFIKIEANSNEKSVKRIDALKEIQADIQAVTDFIAFLHEHEGKEVTKEDVEKHKDMLKKASELMPLILPNSESDHYEANLVNKLKEAKGKYDTLISGARDQISILNMKMSPETTQLNNLIQLLKEIGDIMGKLLNSYAESGKTMTRNQRV